MSENCDQPLLPQLHRRRTAISRSCHNCIVGEPQSAAAATTASSENRDQLLLPQLHRRRTAISCCCHNYSLREL